MKQAIIGVVAAWLACGPALVASRGARSVIPGVRIEIELAKARTGGSGGMGEDGIGVRFDRVGELLGLRSLQPLSTARLRVAVGDEVVQDLGGGYQLAFQVGESSGADRIELRDFELRRTSGSRSVSLLRADLSPWLDRPLVLALTRSAAAPQALLLRLVCVTERATVK